MARKKARQRISYFLPLPHTRDGHRLGVNSLAVDTRRSILYTGGRDGSVCAWDLQRPLQDGDPYAGDQKKPTALWSQTHPHLSWINDIRLVQGGSGVVSASSDMTVKIWRPHSSEEHNRPSVIGKHTDYVRCLASPGLHADWIASGGLDHKIHLWDLNGSGERLAIDAGEDAKADKGSVYALAVRGSLLASGGPDSVLRVWDHKSGKRITKLSGHTDNLRSILISEGGNTLMTASSDQTIKIWSMTAGRCINTLTMHNESVWSLYSDHPQLAVFYSGDRSGLVAKTDVRGNATMDEGISIALAQEHSSINNLVAASGYIWTATASSSINRWRDVDTTAEIQAPSSPRQNRLSSLVSRPKVSSTYHDGFKLSEQSPKIPLTSILKISNTPRLRDMEHATSHSTHGRKPSEAIVDSDMDNVTPIHNLPEETIEGLNGLIEHVMLNDRKRVLTLDAAGDVVLWDLLKCIPIQSFGKRHLEDVTPLVNTNDIVQNWCSVDTRSGCLAVTMEEGYAFDAEVYADETEFKDSVDFREDQRINLGKWILRYLFGSLIDEEIRRDEEYRSSIKSTLHASGAGHGHLVNGGLNGSARGSSEGTRTPRPMHSGYPMTPGLAIGIATPGTGLVPPIPGEEGRPRTSGDYFSSNPPPPPPLVDGEAGSEATTENVASPSENEKDAKGSRFGKKFRMTFPKKFGRVSADQAKPTTADEKAEESDKSSEKDDKVVEDNFLGVVQKIRNEYDEKLAADPLQLPDTGITPSLPSDTPVLKPPAATTILILEESMDLGGVADVYRGTVKSLASDADEIEKAAPMWLGELLLRNTLPFKDIVKLSFVLLPFEDRLPGIAGPDGNARLNANRMLRAKKVLAYVAERIDPETKPGETKPGDARTSQDKSTQEGVKPVSEPCSSEATAELRPEDYLELYCQDQLIAPNMTLAMIKMHVWKSAADVILYYKSNGRKPELEASWAAEKKRKEKDEAENTVSATGSANVAHNIAASDGSMGST